MPATENVELVTFADQLDADSQMRIGNLRSIFPDWAAIAEAVMHVLRDGVDDAVRLRGADQLAIKRFRTPEATWADLVRRLQIDAQHSNLAVLDGETIRHNGPSIGSRIRRASVGGKHGACGHHAGSHRV